jgi:hypothetical protein
MKALQKSLLTLAALFGFSLAGQATVIVDDTWASGQYTNWNLPSQCPWYYYDSLTNLYMTATPGNLWCTNYDEATGVISGIKYWWTYFTTNDPALTVPMTPPGTTNQFSNNTNMYYGHPIDIQPGQMIKITLSFIPKVALMDATKTRFGLLSYDNAPFGRAARSSKMFGKSGTNVPGYYMQPTLQAQWPGNNIIAFRCRTNLNESAGKSADPIGNDVCFSEMGSGPGITNVTGFLLDNQYTLQWTIARYAASNVLTGTISGALAGVAFTNITESRVDLTGTNWHKFDCFCIRVDGSYPSPNVLVLKEFKAEVLPIDFTVAGDRINKDSYRLTFPSWPGFTYQTQSKDDLNAVPWSTLDTFTATAHTTQWTNFGTTGIDSRFYRVVNTQ